MPSTQLGIKVQKIIEMNKDKALLQGAYFSPLFTDRLADKVQDLRTLGFNMVKTETESAEGTVISGKIISPSNEELHLGSVLLDGKNVVVKNTLVPVEKVISFIEEQAVR